MKIIKRIMIAFALIIIVGCAITPVKSGGPAKCGVAEGITRGRPAGSAMAGGAQGTTGFPAQDGTGPGNR